jgi:UDP-N-acetylglucosamine--N-acetylmuramyl-(pentapeptide) pyrophosphoryl-undecaprenol N-acetylglucosamine transferase
VSERNVKHIFFAGGGTGGHIYPNLAVADAIDALNKDVCMTFFCSRREVDARVLGPSGYEFLPLPAVGLSLHPLRFAGFFGQLFTSYGFVKQVMAPVRREAVVVGTGGFVTAPVVMAAKMLKIPVYLINVDAKPGKANRLLGRLAQRVFVQFETSRQYFGIAEKVSVTGCPLRGGFAGAALQKEACREKLHAAGLALDPSRKLLVVTGASSGARNINDAMIGLLGELKSLAAQWQVIHLTGQADFQRVQNAVQAEAGWYKAVDYWDDMAVLLGAADLVVGRAGAVSMAEFAAAGVPAICLPYPYHKDRHQYANAQALTEAGAALIVEDRVTDSLRTAAELGQTLNELMNDQGRRLAMSQAAHNVSRADAAVRIAETIVK